MSYRLQLKPANSRIKIPLRNLRNTVDAFEPNLLLFLNLHLSNLKLHFNFLNLIQNRTTPLTYFNPMIHFFTSQKRKRNSSFQTLSGVIENGKITWSGCKSHYLKSVQIRSFFWSVFSPNAGKDGPEKTPYLDIFHGMRTYSMFF